MKDISQFNKVFFIGIAGTGMSAIAQYLAGVGKAVSGSDRYFAPDSYNDAKFKLEKAGINCFLQNGEGITADTELVIVSTAVEDSVYEVQKAKELNIPIIKRSELLAIIAKSKRTIAVGGTSGKSTTCAMIFDILQYAGLQPSIISGAGLISIINEGKIGNAKVGAGEWLIIEADESDGSIIQYFPEIGLLLNIDKDHQEIDELIGIFNTFKNNTQSVFIVNECNKLARNLSENITNDFSLDENSGAGFIATDFQQQGFNIKFYINGTQFSVETVGRHNVENILAAVAVVHHLQISIETCAKALKNYKGIYRRHQVLGHKNGVWVVDDYAHNPVKCAASIAACQPVAPKVIAWFQPHGYGPTRFLRHDFVKEIASVLREEDEIWMSEIFYAGGTAVKDISSKELIDDIKILGKKAYFEEDKNSFLEAVRPHLTDNCVLLLMGARDPGLEKFTQDLYNK
ncbi:MAG: UDP-N-acetylmuramate--alanine ligase [Chitinophagaceae bacterium]|nr:UDP-N-acetylmuramate--alanine ligase [Chitinophagaceae bacterium]